MVLISFICTKYVITKLKEFHNNNNNNNNDKQGLHLVLAPKLETRNMT